MKRKLLVMTTCFVSTAAFAQLGTHEDRQDIIDWAEDSTEIKTISDIIAEQEKASAVNATEKHFSDVWGRRSYMNFGFSMSKLNQKGGIQTGLGGIVPNFSSNWGASFQYGRNYRLHKKPIANFMQFNFDFTGIDINVNHYAEENGKPLFDSAEPYRSVDVNDKKDYYYTPWQLEKYEGSYNMSLGPSLTIAPFNSVGGNQLHFLKLNFYYHVGYQFNLLFIVGDVRKDKNSDDNVKNRWDEMSDTKAIDWSHGVVQSFGLNLSWKSIGVGYEHRSGKLKYKSLAPGVFSSDKFEFDSSVNRIYLQYRM